MGNKWAMIKEATWPKSLESAEACVKSSATGVLVGGDFSCKGKCVFAFEDPLVCGSFYFLIFQPCSRMADADASKFVRA